MRPWDYLFVDQPSGCITMGNSVTIDVSLYVRGNLCLTNNSQIDSPAVHLLGNLYVDEQRADRQRRPTRSTSSSDRQLSLRGQSDDVRPGRPTSTRSTIGTSPPSHPEADGRPAVLVPERRSSGPPSACTTTGIVPGGFDNDTTLNVSRGEIDLTPSTAYDCTQASSARTDGGADHVGAGRLRPGTLTIKGVIYFDAHLTGRTSTSSSTTGRLSSTAPARCRSRTRADICGVPACDATWDPRVDLLVFVAGSLVSRSRRTTDPKSVDIGNHVNFQGAIYIVNDFDMDNNTTVWGPVITRIDDDQQLAPSSTRRRSRSSGCTACPASTQTVTRGHSDHGSYAGLRRSVNAAAAAFVLAPALALGSFLNVVVARVPARRSLLRPPSSCGSCATEILWRDNIPVLSYLLLRGRCRHCDARISPVYPLVEAVTAALDRRVRRRLRPDARGGARRRLLRGARRALGHRRAAPDRPEPNRRARSSRRSRRAHGDRPEPRMARLVARRGWVRSSSSCSPTRRGSAWETSSWHFCSARCSAHR